MRWRLNRRFLFVLLGNRPQEFQLRPARTEVGVSRRIFNSSHARGKPRMTHVCHRREDSFVDPPR